MKPYQQSVEQVVLQFKTNEKKGLSQKDVAERRSQFGSNELPRKKAETWFSIFVRQFRSPLIYILLIAATIIFFVGPDKMDAFIITGVLLFNAIIGTIQEGRARDVLSALKRYMKSMSVVIRDGSRVIVEDKELVPGDVIVIQEGQKVPADVRLLSANNVTVDESMLTGESASVHKTIDQIAGEARPFEQRNMLFRGTYVLTGHGTAVVVATGVDAEIGKIQQEIAQTDVAIPLKKEIDRLSYWILIFILIMCVLLFVVGFMMGKPLRELLVILTALFICVVPEGLPVVLSLVLVTGVYRMAKRNVLVKNMQAVEALGRTNVIVLDKTGTLTRNEMMVSAVCAGHTKWKITGEGYQEQGTVTSENIELTALTRDDALIQIGIASSLLNTAEVYKSDNGLFAVKGDPTEAALHVFSQKLGLTTKKLQEVYQELYEIPFDHLLRYHAGFYQLDEKIIAYIIGAPERIIERCENIDEQSKQCLQSLLDEGLRVIAIASKEFSLTDPLFLHNDLSDYDEQLKESLTSGLQMLGVCGLQDTIRPEVKDIIAKTRNAGLNVIMATGDHESTALYVAKKAGIFQDGDLSLEGTDLETKSDDALRSLLDVVTVYARVSPHHKLRIIDLQHQKGQVVAMTGDGINDAPSLVSADLGIAMGRIGTEVAKEAADIILLDDSFLSIVSAIEQGRHIFSTLKRVIQYFFTTNFGEILIILFALVANIPLPITAAQILWLNLVTDGFLDIALAMEPEEKGLLSKEWLSKKLQLVDWEVLFKMLFGGCIMALGSLWMFYRYYQTDLVYARTVTLLTLAMFQWFNAWNCRSSKKTVADLGMFSNKWLVLATTFVFLLQIALLHVPLLQAIFKTVPITLDDWGLVILISSSIFFIEEIRKMCTNAWSRRA